MPRYRRAFQPGGTFFFTVVTENRAPILISEPGRQFLHDAFDACRQARSFIIDAVVLLPDHFHLLLTLPPGDADYATRIAFIKSHFTRSYLAHGGQERLRSDSRMKSRRRGVWQRRFWEHAIRDENDFNNHRDYIHYNPIKHNLVECAHAWPYSTFARAVEAQWYVPDWQCTCAERQPVRPEFSTLAALAME
jgi:putative transposase